MIDKGPLPRVPRASSGKQLRELVDRLVIENLRSAMYDRGLEEKENQASTSTALDAALGGDGDAQAQGQNGAQGSNDDAPTHSKTVDADTENLESGEISPDDVIDKLNMIRSGRTLKDQEVKQRMDQYVQSLTAAERTALLSFLKGIAQIVTGEVQAQQASEPSEHPSDIKMDKENTSNKPDPHGTKQKHVQPNVIRGKTPVNAKKPGAENTSAPLPVSPKRRG